MQRSGSLKRLSSVKANSVRLAAGARTAVPGHRDATGPVTVLFRTHQLELVRLARFMVGDLATAEDVVQDAFEQLQRRWPRLRDDASALAYARSCVLNGCRSVHRRTAVARKHAPRLAASAVAGPDTAEVSAEHDAMMAVLRGLPRRQREVLVLRYYADLDVADIAGILGISPSAVRSTAARGLAAMARTLKEN
jgi:RNA polymerase sigma-70 factor (sigma-E family)